MLSASFLPYEYSHCRRHAGRTHRSPLQDCLAHHRRTGVGPARGPAGGHPAWVGRAFTFGKLLAVATLPLSLLVYFWQLTPYGCRRYMLTNRRIIIRKGLMAVDQRWIGFEDFDTVDIDVLPGQAWLHAGDLVLRRGGVEVLRLAGIPRPEAVPSVPQHADALLSVRNVVERQAAKTNV